MTQLPGQTPMAGPVLPSLGPFGSSARVPPPATGSYGNPSGLAGAAFNTTPANYAPSNVQAMSFQDNGNRTHNGGSNIAVAGGVPNNPAMQPNDSGWQETNTNPNMNVQTVAPNMDFSQPPSGLRSGGMTVHDLTNAPPPPGYNGNPYYGSPNSNFTNQPPPSTRGYQGNQGYQPAANAPGQFPPSNQSPGMNQANGWPPQSPPPSSFNSPSPSAPMSGGGFADSSPAANQPAFSSADRPVQWQTPRR